MLNFVKFKGNSEARTKFDWNLTKSYKLKSNPNFEFNFINWSNKSCFPVSNPQIQIFPNFQLSECLKFKLSQMLQKSWIWARKVWIQMFEFKLGPLWLWPTLHLPVSLSILFLLNFVMIMTHDNHENKAAFIKILYFVTNSTKTTFSFLLNSNVCALQATTKMWAEACKFHLSLMECAVLNIYLYENNLYRFGHKC